MWRYFNTFLKKAPHGSLFTKSLCIFQWQREIFLFYVFTLYASVLNVSRERFICLMTYYYREQRMRRFSVSSQPDRIVCSTPDGDVIIPDPSPIYQLLLEECFFLSCPLSWKFIQAYIVLYISIHNFNNAYFICKVIIFLLFPVPTSYGMEDAYFSKSPKDVDVDSGKSVTLPCEVTPDSGITYYWELNGNRFQFLNKKLGFHVFFCGDRFKNC